MHSTYLIEGMWGQVEETARTSPVVLAPPLALEGGLAEEMRPPNVVQQVLSLFRNIRPESDLTHFQVTANLHVYTIHLA
jgi:oxysterol-binding protein-related protein 8